MNDTTKWLLGVIISLIIASFTYASSISDEAIKAAKAEAAAVESRTNVAIEKLERKVDKVDGKVDQVLDRVRKW